MQEESLDLSFLSEIDLEVVKHLQYMIQAFESHGQDKIVKLCRKEIAKILEKYR